MAANKRIYYATQAVRLQPQNSDCNLSNATWYVPLGVQSVGMTTNFNLTQMFTLGQQELYDNVDGTPEVEVTLQKNLDGTIPLYLLCMGAGTGTTAATNQGKQLAELSTNRVHFQLGVYSDTVTKASGSAVHTVTCSGMYLSSIGYSFPIDGFATEDVTLVGNNKVWGSGATLPGNGTFTTNAYNTTLTSKVPVRRVNVNLASSVLPSGRAGIRIPAERTEGIPYVQSISVKANLGREAINELGRMSPYFRYVKFPLEITSEFNVMASDGDYVDAKDFSDLTGCSNNYTNLEDKTISIVVCGSGGGLNDKMSIDLGPKNKLTSVNYTGGDTGGANATITYSFQTFNYFIVSATGSFASGTQAT
jgi:hypothetical protein